MADDRLYRPYPDGMILLVEVGSTAHGTGLPGGEDHDETAVVVETPAQALGLGPPWRTTYSGPSLRGTARDRVTPIGRSTASGSSWPWPRRGTRASCSPFWAPVIETSDLGRDLIALRDAFVGRHVLPRYQGYMQSQVMRMQGLKGSGHGRRGGGKREELIADHGYDTKFAMHAARLGYQGHELVTSGGLTLPVWRRR